MAKNFNELSLQEQTEEFAKYLTKVQNKVARTNETGPKVYLPGEKVIAWNKDKQCKKCDHSYREVASDVYPKHPVGNCRLGSTLCINSNSRPYFVEISN